MLARLQHPGRASSVIVLSGVLLLSSCQFQPILGAAVESHSPSYRYLPFAMERFIEDFGAYGAAPCLTDGDRLGVWQIRFAGYGCVALKEAAGARALSLAPRAPAAADLTHAALVLGPELAGDYVYRVDTRTLSQLREGSPPNPWEVGWIVWNYIDDEHFYYFIPKPNGWELGKRDPAYPGGQRFLATGSWPEHPAGEWYTVEVVVRPGIASIAVGDRELVHHIDEERPYRSGRIAFYTEDADVEFRNVRLSW